MFIEYQQCAIQNIMCCRGPAPVDPGNLKGTRSQQAETYLFRDKMSDKTKIDHLCILKLMTIKHIAVLSACILAKAPALFCHF